MKHIALFLFASASGVAQSVTLTLPSVTATAGATAYLNLQLKSLPGSAPASLEWAINAPAPDVQGITAAALGPAAIAASKMLYCWGNKCVLAGLNSSAMANGTVAVLAVHLSPFAKGNLAIQFSYAKAASATAVDLTVAASNGVVAVASSSASITVNQSPTGPPNSGLLSPGQIRIEYQPAQRKPTVEKTYDPLSHGLDLLPHSAACSVSNANPWFFCPLISREAGDGTGTFGLRSRAA